MCSVVGFYSRYGASDFEREEICEVFKESRIRGLHSFGATVRTPDGEMTTFKFHELSRLLERIKNTEIPFNALIGHGRYSTSGDWKDHNNNQPILAEGASVVFNGVISMMTKEENERFFDMVLETDNDGEIFLRKVTRNAPWIEWIANSKFSFAGMFMDQKALFAIRNKNRPLWFTENGDRVLICSTRDILVRANIKGFTKSIPIPEGQPFDLKDALEPRTR